MKKRKEMHNNWWSNGLLTWSKLVFICIFQLNYIYCLSLKYEGLALLKFKERVVNDPFGALSSWKEVNGEANPCSWFGVGCAGGHVVSLDLKNLCLEGTIAPELHHLWHIQFIVLRNNSFSGTIPGNIGNLKKLKLLDLSYNNFCKPIPDETDLDVPVVLLDNNGISCYRSPEIDGTLVTSSVKVSSYTRHHDSANIGHRRILQEGKPSSPEEINSENQNSTPNPVSPSTPPHFIQFPHIPPSSPRTPSIIFQRSPPPPRQSPKPPSPGETVSPKPPAPQRTPTSYVSVHSHPSPSARAPRTKLIPIVAGAVGGFIGLILVGLLLFVLRSKKLRKTRLSGQLQKVFVAGNGRLNGLNNDKPVYVEGNGSSDGLSTHKPNSFVEGIPNIKRSELETACEDFSNVIGSSSIGTIYKGTLSNGVEVAVISLSATSASDWSRNLETQFRKKIEVLSKVNHKNFVNLIGYCKEEEPFTRLMVFEYAPNGSLFEHLHVREAEHLDWGMRLRVAMGIAYCLDHMHQLTPPVTHPNLNSSAVSLSEDYAAKLSDFCFWNEVAARQVQPMITNSSSSISVSPESNVFSFGLVLLEMMTGQIPNSLKNDLLDPWVLEYMKGLLPLQEMIDPMLSHYDPDQLSKIGDVIRKCLHSEENRPSMKDVTMRLREVTCINQDNAVPRYSSLWWAELDARSINGS